MPAVLTSLNPSSAQIGGPDIALHVIGAGFTPDAAIVFTGGAPTAFVSATELTTTAKPSEVTAAGTYQVRVQQADGTSNALLFTYLQDIKVAMDWHCLDACPDPVACTLPEPWPPYTPAAAAGQQKTAR
jgi:hypothetical protein